MRKRKFCLEKRDVTHATGPDCLFLAEIVIRGVIRNRRSILASTRSIRDLTERPLTSHERLGSRRGPRLSENTIRGVIDSRALGANRFHKIITERLLCRLQ